MSDVMQDAVQDDALDDRQRNMLEAMGIKLWQPVAALALPTPAAQVVLTAAPSPHEKFESNTPVALIKPAQNAIKNIASSAPPAPSLPLIPNPQLAPQPAGIDQMTWPQLQSAVASCQACALCQSRKKTVFGVGQTSADEAQAPQVDWLIVGEAPGEQEDVQGEPFVGSAGKLLDNMLAAMKQSLQSQAALQSQPFDLSRSQGSYIVNVLKCRPPSNRNPSPEEVAMCEPYLARQIELLRPKIILAMGKFAIASLTGHTEAVGKLRGRVHPLDRLKFPNTPAPVIVTYHPAYLLRNLPDKAKAWADLMLAMQTYLAL